LINTINTKWNNQKTFAFHSIVVPPSGYTNPLASKVAAGDPCKGYRESVKYDGANYYDLSQRTGGVKGTICTDNYSSQLTAMGQRTVQLVTSATLDCQIVDGNGDNKIDEKDITITLSNNQNYTDFTLNGNKVSFGSALPAGNQTLSYYCLQ
jgi:hypothetical protein